MNFILQVINGKITLDQCFQMERSKEYWDWKNPNDSFKIYKTTLEEIPYIKWNIEHNDEITCGKSICPHDGFKPEEWCPIGTVEFVEKYIRYYFSDKIDNIENNLKPLNLPTCFTENRYSAGRYVENYTLSESMVNSPIYDNNREYYIKDMDKIKNPLNGVMTLKQAYGRGLNNIQCSPIIPETHISSEWRCFIHNGKIVDIKNYAGSPFVFPNMDDIVNSYMYQLNGTLREGTLDVYVDEIDNETYVMECHKFYSCGLYGFDQQDILPLMYWRTYKEIIS